MEEKLFRLLDGLKEDKVPDDTPKDFSGHPEEALTEAFIIKKIWRMRLRDLSASRLRQQKEKLKQLQKRLQRKFDKYETGLYIRRPRPNALKLCWDKPAPDCEPSDPTAIEECMRHIRHALQLGPQKKEIVTRFLRGKGLTEKTIRKARESLKVRHYQDEAEWYWKLP